MDTVTILRELWDRRILVGLAAVVAILVGLLLTYNVSLPPTSRKYEVSIASGRILVDTPKSQVIDVEPKGSDTLGVRADLLANLMTEGEVKAAIGRRAGLRSGQLVAGAQTAGQLPAVLSSARLGPDAHVLITRAVINAAGEPLPIIELEAQAPDGEGAARLASAAVTGLGAYLDSKAAGEEVPDARRLDVTGLGAPDVREATRGPRRMVALVAALLVFLCGCAAILLVSALARRWRTASEQDAANGVAGDAATPGPALLLPPERRALPPGAAHPRSAETARLEVVTEPRWRTASEPDAANGVAGDAAAPGPALLLPLERRALPPGAAHPLSARSAETARLEVVTEPRALEEAGVGAGWRSASAAEGAKPPRSGKKQPRAKRRKHGRNR